MKVLLVNGSPHPHGCTYTALSEMAGVFEAEGIATEIVQVGTKPVSGCIACLKCKNGSGRCAIPDGVNEFIDKAEKADGFVFGSPVHFAAASGALTSFLDRAFYAPPRSIYRLKPGAAIVSARRGGNTATFDQLNKYFTIAEMPVISSTYWNMVHGLKAEDVKQDLEGLRTMRGLARNMAWFLKCKEAGLKAGISVPENEPPVATNFIR